MVPLDISRRKERQKLDFGMPEDSELPVQGEDELGSFRGTRSRIKSWGVSGCSADIKPHGGSVQRITFAGAAGEIITSHREPRGLDVTVRWEFVRVARIVRGGAAEK